MNKFKKVPYLFLAFTLLCKSSIFAMESTDTLTYITSEIENCDVVFPASINANTENPITDAIALAGIRVAIELINHNTKLTKIAITAATIWLSVIEERNTPREINTHPNNQKAKIIP